MKEHTKYTVYHIPGIKFGCTKHFESRTKQNIKRYGDVDIEVILETTDINEASELEEFSNQEAGYKMYTHVSYLQTVEAGKKGFDKLNANGRTKEHRNNISKALMGHSGNTNGRIWLHNSEGNKYSKPDELQHWLDQGYTLGMKSKKQDLKQAKEK